MQVVVDSLITQYTDSGKGKPVLLLHGWGDSLQGFHGLQAELAKKYNVIAVDLPGFGQTQIPEKTWGLNDYVQFVYDFLSKLDIEPYAIIGHSNGGALAIRGIGSGKLHTNKLILLASSGIRGEYKGRIKAIRLVTKTGKLLTSPLPKGVKQKLRKQVYQTVGSDMLVAEHMQETFKQVVTDDVRADAANITIPTLLLYGAKDTATPPNYGREFQKLIKDSMFEELPDAGHFVHHDQAAAVATRIEEFLS